MAGLKSIQDLRNRVATFNNGLSSGAYIQQIIWDNDAYIVDMNAFNWTKVELKHI